MKIISPIKNTFPNCNTEEHKREITLPSLFKVNSDIIKHNTCDGKEVYFEVVEDRTFAYLNGSKEPLKVEKRISAIKNKAELEIVLQNCYLKISDSDKLTFYAQGRGGVKYKNQEEAKKAALNKIYSDRGEQPNYTDAVYKEEGVTIEIYHKKLGGVNRLKKGVYYAVEINDASSEPYVKVIELETRKGLSEDEKSYEEHFTIKNKSYYPKDMVDDSNIFYYNKIGIYSTEDEKVVGYNFEEVNNSNFAVIENYEFNPDNDYYNYDYDDVSSISSEEQTDEKYDTDNISIYFSRIEQITIYLEQLKENYLAVAPNSQYVIKIKQVLFKLEKLKDNLNYIINNEALKPVLTKRYQVFNFFTHLAEPSQFIVENSQNLTDTMHIVENCESLSKTIDRFIFLIDLYKTALEGEPIVKYIVDLINKRKSLLVPEDNELLKTDIRNVRNILKEIGKDKHYSKDKIDFIQGVYFKLLRELCLPDQDFIKPGFIGRLIPHSQKEIYEVFINGIFSGLNSSSIEAYPRLFMAYINSILKERTDKSQKLLNMDMDYVMHLKYKIIEFIQENHYNSISIAKTNKSLADSFARFMTAYICNYFINYDDYGKGSDTLFDFFNDNSIHNNQQLHRYQCEIALKILDYISLNIFRDFQAKRNANNLKTQLKRFIVGIEYSKTIHTLVFENWSIMENRKLYFTEEFNRKLIDALATDDMKFLLGTSEYDKKKRSDFLVLHPFIRIISEVLRLNPKNFYGDYHKIVWAFFDHLEKKGFHTDLEDDLTQLLKSEENSGLIKQNQLLNKLDNLINNNGLNSIGGRSFFENNIIDNMVDIISSSKQNDRISQIVRELYTGVENIYRCIKLLMPKDCKKIDYSPISKSDSDYVKAIMLDRLDDNMLFEETVSAEYFSKIILGLTEIFSDRIRLFAKFNKTLKVQFEKNNFANQQRIVKFKDKQRRDELKKYLNKSNDNPGFLFGQLCLKILNRAIDKAANAPDKIAYLDQFINNYDGAIEREIGFFAFTLEDMCKAGEKLNGFKINGVKQYFNEHLDIEEVKEEKADLVEINNRFGGYVKNLRFIGSGDIERFERNQVLAIHVAKEAMKVSEVKKPPMFFRIATGNGKTLVEATIALEYLSIRENQNKKILLITSSDNLAERDQKAMAPFFRKYNINSCFITSEEDVKKEWDSSAQILYTSISFVRFIPKLGFEAYKSEKVRQFLKIFYQTCNNSLVLLDEFDLILDVPERQWSTNCIELFPMAMYLLKSQGYQRINNKLGLTIDNLLANNRTPQSGLLDQSGQGVNYSGGFGYELNQGNLWLTCARFSLKSLFKNSEITIGFSGSINKENFNNYKDWFPNIDVEKSLFKVPLFFAPYIEGNPNIKERRIHANQNQLRLSKELSGLVSFELIKPALTEQVWLEAIKNDVNDAKDQGQPVVIFADPQDIDKIQNYISVNHVYKTKEDTKDNVLQKIANPGFVAICTKIVGRGADIRMPISIENGLHVLITRPDYEAEITQQIGRTGRMNRKGTFSLIFRDDQSIPKYDENQLNDLEKNSLLHDLSGIFYSQDNINPEHIPIFAWFINCIGLTYDDKIKRGNDLDKNKLDKNELMLFMKNDLRII